MERPREILTPDQAAEYLQVNRETIYRYIREGKLMASKLGRAYRIPKDSIDRLLLVTRTRPDIQLREFTEQEIAAFEEADKLTGRAKEIADQFDRFIKHQSAPQK